MLSYKHIAAALAVLLTPNPATALSFEPTGAEWAGWTPYCRARYVVSGAGSGSRYVNAVSGAEVSKWKGRLGQDGWYGLHHHCAGLVLYKRALVADSQKSRKSNLEHAFSESRYAAQRTKPENPVYALIKVHMARCKYELGEVDNAFSLVRDARRYHPKASESYAAEAIFLYRQKAYKKAAEILRSGIAQVAVPSGELHYFLGLTLLKLNDLEGAAESAKLAYKHGYNLPGLQRRLAQAGHKLSQQ